MEKNYPHHDEYSSLNIILNSDKLYNNVSCQIKLLARHGIKFKFTVSGPQAPRPRSSPEQEKERRARSVNCLNAKLAQ